MSPFLRASAAQLSVFPSVAERLLLFLSQLGLNPLLCAWHRCLSSLFPPNLSPPSVRWTSLPLSTTPLFFPLGPFPLSQPPPRPRYLERHIAQLALPPDLLHDAVATTRQLRHGEMHQVLQLLRAVLHHLPQPPQLRRPGR